MSIVQFIEQVCVQDAVYWGNPHPDGFGGLTYDAPISIKVRWDEKAQLVLDQTGKEILSKTQIMCPQELHIQGVVMLGESIEVGQTPQTVNATNLEALEIKARTKTPLFQSKDEFVYMYYLSPMMR